MTWNKSSARGNGGATATAPTRTPVTVRNVVAEAAQESALRRQEIQALLEEYARKQEGAAATAAAGSAIAPPAAVSTAKTGAATAAAPAPALRPAPAKSSSPTTPASIDRRLHSLEASIARIEAKISGGVKADKVDEITSIVEDLLVRVRSLRG